MRYIEHNCPCALQIGPRRALDAIELPGKQRGYRAVLNQGPDNPAVRLNLALANYKKGEFSSAAGELTPLQRRQPTDARVATLLGDCFLHLVTLGKRDRERQVQRDRSRSHCRD